MKTEWFNSLLQLCKNSNWNKSTSLRVFFHSLIVCVRVKDSSNGNFFFFLNLLWTKWNASNILLPMESFEFTTNLVYMCKWYPNDRTGNIFLSCMQVCILNACVYFLSLKFQSKIALVLIVEHFKISINDHHLNHRPYQHVMLVDRSMRTKNSFFFINERFVWVWNEIRVV